MRVRYGTPELALPPLNPIKLGGTLQQIFPELEDKHINHLVDLAHEASAQKKGVLLIIDQNSESEAKRLAKQATLIQPIILACDFVTRFTSIDGALLLNPQGVCFAIGAILDGMATESGDPAVELAITHAFATLQIKKNA